MSQSVSRASDGEPSQVRHLASSSRNDRRANDQTTRHVHGASSQPLSMFATSCRQTDFITLTLKPSLCGLDHVETDFFHRVSARNATWKSRHRHRISSQPFSANFRRVCGPTGFKCHPHGIGKKPATPFPKVGQRLLARHSLSIDKIKSWRCRSIAAILQTANRSGIHCVPNPHVK